MVVLNTPLVSHSVSRIPNWVPEPVHRYVVHTAGGCAIRAIARRSGECPSTVLRGIRRIEQKRDDPLFDAALTTLEQVVRPSHSAREFQQMTVSVRASTMLADEETISREARRILRRLCETGAFLAIAPNMEDAVVLKATGKEDPVRIAVVKRAVAEAFAIKDWISGSTSGRVARYRITAEGRSALKRMLAEDSGPAQGFAEAPSPFAEQHRDWAERRLPGADGEPARRVRFNLAESPLAILARRKDKTGQPFLSPELVAAGERLREDFELSQMGPRVTQNWDKFLTASDRGSFGGGGPAEGPLKARNRVAAALKELGPGLGDVVLRCCCFLEGLEAAEKRMGWSARSGKIVLRIALQRLRRHYDEHAGPDADLIG